ncbi:MAG: modulated transcriptional regulator, LuxR family [Marmoricola sp.]|nr:modulated transcriptional regulator, LuxR family [Marmoricola sp.]
MKSLTAPDERVLNTYDTIEGWPTGSVPGPAPFFPVAVPRQRVSSPIPDDEPQGWAAVARVQRIIGDLREIRTISQLVAATPAAVCRLGFDRAMVSRVDESSWVVEKFHSTSDPVWAAEINAVAATASLRLAPTLFETDMIRRRAPVLVLKAQDNDRVNQDLANVTMSRSYVAAPIMPDGQVIGFLHADRYDQGVDVSAADLQTLAYFTDQFGQLVARTLLLERLDSLGSSVSQLTEALNGTVADCRQAPIAMSPSGVGSSSGLTSPLAAFSSSFRAPGPASPDTVLTSRELEVLRHMAAGDTNSRIASRLVISEGTVKSHVKHILRKLGAANRAEAVCRWLQKSQATVA